MNTISIDLEQSLEAADGVVEVERLRPHLDLAWAVVQPGPRRWAPTDLHVETSDDGDRLDVVRMTYRTVGERSVVIAGLRPDGDVDDLAERLARPLMFGHLRRVHPEAPTSAIVAAMDCVPQWHGTGATGWATGIAGIGDRPVRLAHLDGRDGHILLASHGVAEEEVLTIIDGLVHVGRDDEEVLTDLHVRHRQALAQRWWDAPRTPWLPTD